MLLSSLPPELVSSTPAYGRIVAKVMQDLTVYLAGPTEQELEYLISLYEQLCPKERQKKYKIAELPYWVPLAQPQLTQSGRAAQANGIPRPYLEPVRRRIREGRAFEIQFWDGHTLDDPNGSWSFACRRLHLRKTGHHTFVRFMMPLQSDLEVLKKLAMGIANYVALHSGHGGLTFTYDPWMKDVAFDMFYAQSRRYWGVDIEDLNATLPLMKKGIKGVSWITMIGSTFLAEPGVASALNMLASRPDVMVESRQLAAVLLAGPQPVAGDQHRADATLAPYVAIAKALKPLFLPAHPDFAGERFASNGNTLGWLHRFIDPAGWR